MHSAAGVLHHTLTRRFCSSGKAAAFTPARTAVLSGRAAAAAEGLRVGEVHATPGLLGRLSAAESERLKVLSELYNELHTVPG